MQKITTDSLNLQSFYFNELELKVCKIGNTPYWNYEDICNFIGKTDLTAILPECYFIEINNKVFLTEEGLSQLLYLPLDTEGITFRKWFFDVLIKKIMGSNKSLVSMELKLETLTRQLAYLVEHSGSNVSGDILDWYGEPFINLPNYTCRHDFNSAIIDIAAYRRTHGEWYYANERDRISNIKSPADQPNTYNVVYDYIEKYFKLKKPFKELIDIKNRELGKDPNKGLKVIDYLEMTPISILKIKVETNIFNCNLLEVAYAEVLRQYKAALDEMGHVTRHTYGGKIVLVNEPDNIKLTLVKS